MKFRFGLRSAAVAIALICLALWAVPLMVHWAKWRMVRSVVDDTMLQIENSPGAQMYVGRAFRDEYCLANVEVNWDSKTDSGNVVLPTPRKDAVFVEVPGKVHRWVNSTDEVMVLLKEADAKK